MSYNDAVENQTNLAWDTLVDVDGDSRAGPRHRRLTNALRARIRDGTIRVGSALPPSRHLASELGCSRWVVTEAYEQLVAEGYLQARIGSGTRVRMRDQSGSTLSQQLAATPDPVRYDLRPGLADLRAFPRTSWSRAYRDVIAKMAYSDLAYPPPGGDRRLRQVLAE